MKYSRIEWWRTVCMTVAACLLLSACTSEGRGEKVNSQAEASTARLAVESVEVTYTPEERESVTVKLQTLLSRVLLLRDGLVLSERELAETEIYIQDNVLPLLCRTGVGFSDAVALCDAVLARTDETVLTQTDILLDFYIACMGVLGSRRGGEMLFESAVLYATEKRDRARERYEAYGYEWYLADAEKYAAHLEALNERIGAVHFSAVLGVCFFGSSLTSGAFFADTDSEFSLTDGEVRVLWQRQARHFREQMPPAHVCAATAELLFDWFCADADVPDGLSRLESEYRAALRECNEHATRVGSCLPLLADLYAQAADALTAEDVAILRRGTPAEREGVLCRILTCVPESFTALTDELGREPFAHEKEREALLRAGEEAAFSAYADRRQEVTPRLLLALAEDYAAYPDARRRDAMARALENYAFAVAPYATFVWHETQSS